MSILDDLGADLLASKDPSFTKMIRTSRGTSYEVEYEAAEDDVYRLCQ